MALSNAERQKRWRRNRQGNAMVHVSLMVPRDVAPEVRALEKFLRDLDIRVVSCVIQDPKTGRLHSVRL